MLAETAGAAGFCQRDTGRRSSRACYYALYAKAHVAAYRGTNGLWLGKLFQAGLQAIFGKIHAAIYRGKGTNGKIRWLVRRRIFLCKIKRPDCSGLLEVKGGIPPNEKRLNLLQCLKILYHKQDRKASFAAAKANCAINWIVKKIIT